MTKPWLLTNEQKHTLVLSGYSADDIADMEAKREVSYYEIREAVYGDDQEAADRHFYEKYGFEHPCTCVNDKFTGNVQDNVPICTLEMGDKVLEHLSKVLQERDSLAEEVADLRARLVGLD